MAVRPDGKRMSCVIFLMVPGRNTASFIHLAFLVHFNTPLLQSEAKRQTISVYIEFIIPVFRHNEFLRVASYRSIGVKAKALWQHCTTQSTPSSTFIHLNPR